MFDVAIIGGGPAGAWAACKLAVSGAKVALIDGSHPREKPCGGGVTGRALALLRTPAREIGGVSIDGARFQHDGTTVDVPLTPGRGIRRSAPGTDSPGDPEPPLVVVSRATFDAHLIQRATAAGATLHPTRAVDVDRSNGRWRVMTRNGDVAARWLIGADGPASLVRRRLSQPFAREDLSIASGYYVRGHSSRAIDIALESDPPGYLWSFPRPDHLAVGVCAQADGTSSARLLELTDQWLDGHVPTGERRRYSWPIPSLRAATLEREQPAGQGWMLIGDAAGVVDPITREGIFFALQSAELAAASLAQDGESSSNYVSQLRGTIYTELLIAARLKTRFFRPQFMGLLVSALRRSHAIRRVMADLVAGEQPYHTLKSRLLRTLEWKLMLELFGLRRT